jgi:hypothetical protein
MNTNINLTRQEEEEEEIEENKPDEIIMLDLILL